ncbi:unnamed protein product [Clonostachys rosea]|uniref:Zn(2)-C6 fungal-type domain-containing protein n=1 Tax=Bionectria ochroleuca TaxID=29856 RepID=A0ABY6U9Q2_BIOOC|nr:unnamed protein product [Clonostachys rosea]
MDSRKHPDRQPISRRRRRPIVPDGDRKRVKAACVSCRSNKLKCDNRRPCQRCQKTDTECHFAETPTPIRVEVSQRERLLEIILQKHGITLPSNLDSLRYSTQPGTEKGEHSSPRTCTGPQDTTPMNLADNAQILPDDQEDSSVVVGHAPTSHTYILDQGKTFFNGRFSTWTFFDSVQEAVATDQTSHSPGETTTSYNHFMIESPEGLFADLRTSLLAAMPPREVLGFLTSTFFRHSQTNFFWVHPEIFSRKQDAFLNGTHEFDPHNRNHGKRPTEFICLLFMVLALGSQYADLDQDDHSPTRPSLNYPSVETFDISSIKVPTLKKNPGWRFYLVARRLLSDVVCSCSMTTIQACALQGVFLITASAYDIAYNMWGLAVRMCVTMGLHQAVRDAALHPHIRELRNRLWWSVSTLDSLFGYWMGRPTMFDDKDCDTPFPQDLPELQLEQPTRSVLGQIALIKMCRIIDRIVKNIYPPQAHPGKRQVINMEPFVELQDALEKWKFDLPPQLELNSLSTRGVVHLHLTQRHAVMLMTRASLSHAAATIDSGPDSRHSLKTKFLLGEARQCISAATSTIELLKCLEKRGLLCKYAFQDPLYCTAALCVLLLAAKLEPPGAIMKRTIIQGLLLLQHLSNGSETANYSLEGIVNGFKPYFQPICRETAQIVQASTPTTRAQGRKAWEAWISQATRPTSPVMAHQVHVAGQTLLSGGPSIALSNSHDDYWTNSDSNSRDDLSLARTTGSDIMPALYPNYQSLALDSHVDIWTEVQPFWFSELEDDVAETANLSK